MGVRFSVCLFHRGACRTENGKTNEEEAIVTSIAILRPPVYANRQFIDYPYFTSFAVWQVAYALRLKGHEVSVLDALTMPTASVSIEEDGYFRFGCNDRTWRKAVQGLRDTEWSVNPYRSLSACKTPPVAGSAKPTV